MFIHPHSYASDPDIQLRLRLFDTQTWQQLTIPNEITEAHDTLERIKAAAEAEPDRSHYTERIADQITRGEKVKPADLARAAAHDTLEACYRRALTNAAGDLNRALTAHRGALMESLTTAVVAPVHKALTDLAKATRDGDTVEALVARGAGVTASTWTQATAHMTTLKEAGRIRKLLCIGAALNGPHASRATWGEHWHQPVRDDDALTPTPSHLAAWLTEIRNGNEPMFVTPSVYREHVATTEAQQRDANAATAKRRRPRIKVTGSGDLLLT